LKVTILGTGTSQGVPVIGCDCDVCTSMDYRDKRLRSSVHLEVDGKSLVIDTGPDFRQQMLRERINRLDAVIFTHGHKDHLAGLDDVRAYNFLQQTDMPIYGTRVLLDQIRLEFAYAFDDFRYPGIPQLALTEIDEQSFTAAGVSIQPLPVLHLHMPVMGYRVGDFSYITDANKIPDPTYRLLQGTRVLVLNALQKQKHVSHFTLEEAIAIAQKVGARQTYLTHISHKMGKHKDVEKELPEGINLAVDSQVITL
jgi:phosphoribosyl 1,2-cyclic phosphate phosphodiesterase